MGVSSTVAIRGSVFIARTFLRTPANLDTIKTQMGNKISAVHGVKSDHFYEQGNAINEIWVGDIEVISRLPFGDSDLEQAGWPRGGFPKIPWHQFLIPMHKRDGYTNKSAGSLPWNVTETHRSNGLCRDWLPRHGYLGMYTKVSPDPAYFIGTVFFLLAASLYIVYTYTSTRAIDNWVIMRSLSGFLSNAADMRRKAWRDLWMNLGRAFSALVLCVLCLVLGLPALAAGARGMDAATFILLNGLIVTVGVIVSGFLVQPLAMLWLTRPRSANTNTAEES